jgi:hypothetical protein
MIKTLTLSVKILLTVISVVLLFALFFYCQTSVFSFPKTAKFTGNEYYNPYESVGKETLKANFHAHTVAYGGVTNGSDGYSELKDFYKKRGIDVPVISNYFSKSSGDIQVYEHGVNIPKSHKLAINADEELYFDYPFYQSASQKQDIISRLREKNALVVIAHPNMREGHNQDDMAKLVGYHFTEIRSYYAHAEKYWDAALKEGRLSWLMVNDDSHGIVKQLPGRFYNVVFADEERETLKAMEAGKHYGIAQKEDTADLKLNLLSMQNDKVIFDLGENAFKTILVADGVKVDSVEGGNGTLVFPKYASYVRLVAESEHCHLYTNPITRQADGQSFTSISTFNPKLKPFQTILVRSYFVITFVSILFAMIRMWVRIPAFRVNFRKTVAN